MATEIPAPTGAQHAEALARISDLERKVAHQDLAMAQTVMALDQITRILDGLVNKR